MTKNLHFNNISYIGYRDSSLPGAKRILSRESVIIDFAIESQDVAMLVDVKSMGSSVPAGITFAFYL